MKHCPLFIHIYLQSSEYMKFENRPSHDYKKLESCIHMGCMKRKLLFIHGQCMYLGILMSRDFSICCLDGKGPKVGLQWAQSSLLKHLTWST